jgi:predicted nucleic acid-binding protein
MRGLFLGSEPIAFLVSIERSWLDEIAAVQEKMTEEKRPVSYTEAANIVTCQKLKIPQIVSFDGHYEGHLQVIK